MRLTCINENIFVICPTNLNYNPLKQRKGGAVSLVAILILAILAFGIRRCRNSKQNYPDRPLTTEQGDWRHHKLIYTSHARCRMQCRDISESEVEYVLASGTVNPDKSREMDEEAAGHCPTYALEADTKDGQHVRIVFAACDKITKVITAIDLGVEHQCNCR
jgi:hypothetical protein